MSFRTTNNRLNPDANDSAEVQQSTGGDCSKGLPWSIQATTECAYQQMFFLVCSIISYQPSFHLLYKIQQLGSTRVSCGDSVVREHSTVCSSFSVIEQYLGPSRQRLSAHISKCFSSSVALSLTSPASICFRIQQLGSTRVSCGDSVVREHSTVCSSFSVIEQWISLCITLYAASSMDWFDRWD
jgi:hypothetical protein